MGSRLRSSTLLFSLAAIAFALLAGIFIPLAGGGSFESAQLDWTPSAALAMTTTAQAALTSALQASTPMPAMSTTAPAAPTRAATVPVITKAPPTLAAATQAPATAAPAAARTNAAATTAAPAPAPTARTSSPSGAANATIATAAVNLRAGPGTTFPVMGTTKGGEQFTATGRSEDSQWVQLCCVGPNRVWAAVDYVELTSALEDYPIVE